MFGRNTPSTCDLAPIGLRISRKLRARGEDLLLLEKDNETVDMSSGKGFQVRKKSFVKN